MKPLRFRCAIRKHPPDQLLTEHMPSRSHSIELLSHSVTLRGSSSSLRHAERHKFADMVMRDRRQICCRERRRSPQKKSLQTYRVRIFVGQIRAPESVIGSRARKIARRRVSFYRPTACSLTLRCKPRCTLRCRLRCKQRGICNVRCVAPPPLGGATLQRATQLDYRRGKQPCKGGVIATRAKILLGHLRI